MSSCVQGPCWELSGWVLCGALPLPGFSGCLGGWLLFGVLSRPGFFGCLGDWVLCGVLPPPGFFDPPPGCFGLPPPPPDFFTPTGRLSNGSVGTCSPAAPFSTADSSLI